ncbi:hypothetical protein CYLTODRAFT_387821 [Cylindrobasidium torrendii FP15055 ss-10]|uniref:Rap-GAP domain-containing protein n=1 Tax=Cylindrobasidium torrendii FP15055 ss-10 TaxID=1314674 RepID=A0A0D7BS04_9AGAR|nr:hypothetical protein CYLTODRAFT_387821 [Cylindrobasidium torrendii FP15055 ss-10]
MSRPDVETNGRRSRANTGFWARTRRPTPISQNTSSSASIYSTTPMTLSVDALLYELSQSSAAPSLGHARALAEALPTHSPLPPCSTLLPILNRFCSNDSPTPCQVAGFDILAGYWDNDQAGSLGTADRLTFFSLFLGSPVQWSLELWEPRFKALRAVSKFGADIVGNEIPFLELLKSWINGAFDRLGAEGIERAEELQRERSIGILAEFLTSIADKPEIAARVPEQDLRAVVQFYAQLVDRFIVYTPEQIPTVTSPAPSEPESRTSTPSRPAISHKRHPSSMSGLASPLTPSSIAPPSKTPADIAVDLYLKHLSLQIPRLTAASLHGILPVCFRAMSAYAVPLTRLSIPTAAKTKLLTTEDRIIELVERLFNGRFSSTCLAVLKRHLSPPPPEEWDISDMESYAKVAATCSGAHRTLRYRIRRALTTRLARAYISQQASLNYAHSGAPGSLDIEEELMERAFDDVNLSGWEAGKLGKAMADSVQAWVDLGMHAPNALLLREGKERVLGEMAGTLRDIMQELDDRDEMSARLDDQEAVAVGETLYNLAGYILHLVNPDGTPVDVHLGQNPLPVSGMPLLRLLSSLLSRDHSLNCQPDLCAILLRISRHLSDVETAKLPAIMANQHDITPTSPDWLDRWKSILDNSAMVGVGRVATTAAVMDALWDVYESVRDMPSYRGPLADVVYDYCRKTVASPRERDLDECTAIWRVLGDEVVLRTEDGEDVKHYLELLEMATDDPVSDDADTVTSGDTSDTRSSSPVVHTPTPSRHMSDFPSREREGLMSILSSFTGTASRSQSTHPQVFDESVTISGRDAGTKATTVPLSVGGVSALISIFAQLSFTSRALEEECRQRALQVYQFLLKILDVSQQTKVRLAVLQFLMRVRADRAHRLYYKDESWDVDRQVFNLASLIGRTRESPVTTPDAPTMDAISELRRARARMPHDQDPSRRRNSRGRGVSYATSRSRSRVPALSVGIVYETLWRIPETYPFAIADADIPSDGIITYDPLGPGRQPVLAVSLFLKAVCTILEEEHDWELLSYVLCHLPAQLANKHLFCGPETRKMCKRLLTVLCKGLAEGSFAGKVNKWPLGLRAVDAHGLVYHSLANLVSYRRCFSTQECHMLVQTLVAGLDLQAATQKSCLHTLCVAVYELPASVTKYMSHILEKLSRIMSNPHMATHILGLLNIIGSSPKLHANFTDEQFKTVFGVALQYLQHYNERRHEPVLSWSLAQHVRILSFGTLYVWFLAVKMGDRPGHIPYITRQLLLANEGNGRMDDATEVCFDWLSRYAYGSADSRPATSLFSELIMGRAKNAGKEEAASLEKTWIMGNAVVTIRTLVRLGWFEILVRRPSGYIKWMCRLENAPMVGVGDVDPDLDSMTAALVDERGPPTALNNGHDGDLGDAAQVTQHQNIVDRLTETDTEVDVTEADEPARPDPISGYVWSKTAPSQRRKDVVIDPSFFPLQFSGYPHTKPTPVPFRGESKLLQSFIRSIDRLPVIDTHKVGVLYVAPGQTDELEILRNTYGSPAYTRFLEHVGRLIDLRGQEDVYAGGLDPEEDGAYAYAWWDDIKQILFHTATMMPTHEHDQQCTRKKSHVGNDFVRIVWNDGGRVYRFDTLSTQFQFVNIVIEPHSLGAIAAFSTHHDDKHGQEGEYMKVTVQRAEGMADFAPIGEYKIVSAAELPSFVRQLCLLGDWYGSMWSKTKGDTVREEVTTNWHERLMAISRFKEKHGMTDREMADAEAEEQELGIMSQQSKRDFSTSF